MKYSLCAFFILIAVATSQTVFAQSDSDSFTVSVGIFGVDTNAPTTPVLLSVEPVSSSQIDVAWSSSTDDFLVAGYRVFRDSVVIATTTLLNFADTGLVASTTYSYFVQAFDGFLNYSSSSNSLSTTTIEEAIVSENNSNPSGTAARVVVDTIGIDAGFTTSTISVKTVRASRIEFRWGRSSSYELGYIVGNNLKREHELQLTDLEPGTIYEYEIIGYTTRGVATVLESGSFTTQSDEPRLAPENVSQFTAMQDDANIVLTWKNPTSDTFAYVRVVRSHLGFPEYVNDGAVVYQGGGESMTDVDILNVYSPVYYTAFVYDIYGNISSGALSVIYGANSLPSDNTDGQNIIQTPVITVDATTTIDAARVTPDMKMPDASDILVLQNGFVFTLIEAPLHLDGSQPFVISIPVTSVAGNLKSIIATMLHPTDTRESYSFLLRINKDQSAYTTSIAPLGVGGKSQLQIEIYDYEAFVVATYQAPITFVVPIVDSQIKTLITSPLFYGLSILLSCLAAFGFFWWFFILWRRRTEDKPDEE